MIPLAAAWEAIKPFRYWIGMGVGLVMFLGGLWLALDAYGDRRYDQGRTDNESAWRAAEAKLHAQERKSAGAADQAAAVREADHAAAVASEKGKIDDAIREGSSPFDVLFGGSGGVCDGKAGGCQPPGSR